MLDLRFSMLRFTVLALLDDPRGWTLQGFGMLRKYLTPDVRLHVWSRDHVAAGVTTIHDHPWSFTSIVVAGEIIDRSYRINSSTPPTHHKIKITCGEGGGVRSDALPDVSLMAYPDRRFLTGDSYHHHYEDLHETFAQHGTVTIVSRRRGRDDSSEATVCVPFGSAFGSAEPRAATPAEVEYITQNAKARIKSEAGLL